MAIPISITLRHNGEIFMTCRDIQLDPYAVSTHRKFTFRDITFKKHLPLTVKSHVTIHVACGEKGTGPGFSMILSDAGSLYDNEWWIYGQVYNSAVYPHAYHQDAINLIKKGEPIDKSDKATYLNACYYLTKHHSIIVRDTYEIDFTHIQDLHDFCCLAGEAFKGVHGYIAHDLHSLENNYQLKHIPGKKEIHFIHTTHTQLQQDVKQIFINIGFVVID